LVTNLAAGMDEGGVAPDAIIGVGVQRAETVGRLIGQVVRGM
jgi:hypothetical protein